MTRHLVCRLDEVAPGVIKPVTAGRGTILLTRLPAGEIKAVGGRCPHQGANLQHGCLTGYVTGDCPNDLHSERPGKYFAAPGTDLSSTSRTDARSPITESSGCGSSVSRSKTRTYLSSFKERRCATK